MTDDPYNPLDKLNLARSIENELLIRAADPLEKCDHIKGAGVYVLYYTGAFVPYAQIAAANSGGMLSKPIYIGKAIPKGGRKGGIANISSSGVRALAARLRQHASSVNEAVNLDLADFQVRHLVVDDIWIPLGENMLIETFKPVWNRAIDGFGNNDPGRRRAQQYKSPWDILHPGRRFAEKQANGGMTRELLETRVADYLAGRPLARLPRVIVEQQREARSEAEDHIDEV